MDTAMMEIGCESNNKVISLLNLLKFLLIEIIYHI